MTEADTVAQLAHGARLMGAEPVGLPVIGVHGRTVGCRVITSAGSRWLRLVFTSGVGVTAVV